MILRALIAAAVAVLIVSAATYAEDAADVGQEEADAPDDILTRHWACWSWWGSRPIDFAAITAEFVNQGDPLHTCNWATYVHGTGIEARSDGTGFITQGYTMVRTRRANRQVLPYDPTRLARIRWSYDRDTGELTVITEHPTNGRTHSLAWQIVAPISENVIRMRSDASRRSIPILWIVDTPEDDALQEWRTCMQGNYKKGFDTTPCPDPLANFRIE